MTIAERYKGNKNKVLDVILFEKYVARTIQCFFYHIKELSNFARTDLI